MTEFRMWLVLLLLWLCFLFNLERLHEPINIASFVYVMCGLLAASIVSLPPMGRAGLSWCIGGSLLLLVVLKNLLGYELWGAYLPLTVTEAVAVMVTVALAHQIARRVWRFEEGAADVTAIHRQASPRLFREGQAEMYREIRRARRAKRPVSVVVLEPTPKSMKISVNHLVQDVQREMIERYVEMRLADVLIREIQDCDLITTHKGRFLVLLTETDRDQAEFVMQKIACRAQEEMALDLSLGTAVFPDDEVTLTGLVERAESKIVGLSPQPNGHRREVPTTG